MAYVFPPPEAGLRAALESPTGPLLRRRAVCHGAGLLCLVALAITMRKGKQVWVVVQPCGETRFLTEQNAAASAASSAAAAAASVAVGRSHGLGISNKHDAPKGTLGANHRRAQFRA